MEEINLINPTGNLLNYSLNETLLNISFSIIIGLILSFTYKKTHKGLSYSQSYSHMLVIVTLVVAIVMMVIGNSLARAFALVGALSIIRFRTVLKDTKDLAYVFASLDLGMAAGTSNYFLALIGTVSVIILVYLLTFLNFGATYKSEFILRFRLDRKKNDESYLQILKKYSKLSNLLHVEQSGDSNTILISYDLTLKNEMSNNDLIQELSKCKGVSGIVLIASKNDIDY